jgi:hypothetical protein
MAMWKFAEGKTVNVAVDEHDTSRVVVVA